MANIIIKRNEGDRTTEILIDKRSVASANYDEHGWAGLSLIEDMAKNVAKVLKLKLVEKDA